MRPVLVIALLAMSVVMACSDTTPGTAPVEDEELFDETPPIEEMPPSVPLTERLVYVSPSSNHLVSERPDGSDVRLLLADALEPRTPVYNGRVVIGRQGREYAVFDIRTGQRFSVTPWPVNPDAEGASGSIVALTRDGQLVVWTHFQTSTIWASRFDGADRRIVHTLPWPFYVKSFAGSPDGKWMAYSAGEKGVWAVDGTKWYSTTLREHSDFGITWSRDNRRIWFGGTGGQIVRLTRDGLNVAEEPPVPLLYPDWQPYGNSCAGERIGGQSREGGIVGADGVFQSIGTAYDLRWSPSGRYILYRDSQFGAGNYYVLETATMEKRMLGRNTHVVWSAD